MYREFRDRNFTVLGFPCNQFGGQDSGTDREIQDFAKQNYDVTFPLFAKIDVNGEQADPLYQHLKSEKGGLFNEAIKWNFTKFLVDRNGAVVERYAPTTEPKQIRKRILELL